MAIAAISPLGSNPSKGFSSPRVTRGVSLSAGLSAPPFCPSGIVFISSHGGWCVFSGNLRQLLTERGPKAWELLSKSQPPRQKVEARFAAASLVRFTCARWAADSDLTPSRHNIQDKREEAPRIPQCPRFGRSASPPQRRSSGGHFITVTKHGVIHHGHLCRTQQPGFGRSLSANARMPT